jgi:hypothetical protein
MKYGLTLFCDERAEFKTDQIALVDRVLESFEDVSQLRSRSVCARNTNDMLQVVRSSYSDIQQWCQFFLRQDKPVYAYVVSGLSELQGGGSYYWNERHLESLIVELKAHQYEIVLVTTHIKGLNQSQASWLGKYKEQCRELATKHGCDTLHVALKNKSFNSKAIERFSQRIAKDLKDRYADAVVGIGSPVINNSDAVVDKSVEKPKRTRRLRGMVERVEDRKRKATEPTTTKPLNVDREQVEQLSKVASQADTKPPKKKKKTTRKRKPSTVTIERF